MKITRKAILALALSTVVLAGCSRAQANKQTLVTSDCGVTWTLIPAGNSVGAQIGPCSYKVTIPDYPMTGETKFRTSFKERVLANVEIAYEYSIIDGKSFIGEAKYIGRANSEAEDETNASTQYESAENTVIDKRLRDLVGELLTNEDIVELNQGAFEERLLEEINKRLANKGVRLNFLSFVPIPDEQTRQAIDVATAARVYESRGLTDVGRAVMIARAGAPKVTVTNEVPAPAKSDEN
jgi:hypothetical protein